MRKNLMASSALVAVAIVSIFYLNKAGLDLTRNLGTNIAYMSIDNTNGLVPGSGVLLSGVAIGRVVSVEPTSGGADVKWEYKKNYKIPKDATYRVDNLSALGETYIGISSQNLSGPSLPNGARISAAAVVVPTTIDEFSARLTRVLEQVNSRSVQNIVNTTNTGLISDQQVLSRLNHASALLESAIMSTSQQFYDLLRDFQPVLSNGAGISGPLAASGDPVERFSNGLSDFITVMGKKGTTSKDGKDGLIATVNAPYSLNTAAKRLLEHVQTFLDKSAPDLKVLGAAALPSVQSATAMLKTVDLSQLMRSALAAAGDGNGIVVRVGGGR